MVANLLSTCAIVAGAVAVGLLAEGTTSVDSGWVDVIQSNVLVAIALAAGIGIVWLAKRFAGEPNGIFTQLTKSIIETNTLNASTLVKMQETIHDNAETLRHLGGVTAEHSKTLIVLADNIRVMTEKHVTALAQVSAALAEIVKRNNKLDRGLPMAVNTLPIPTADEAQQIATNQHARRHNMVELPLGQKLAAVLLELNQAVTPANYAALGAAINAIAGIDGITLLIDGQTPASIPAGTSLYLHVDAQLRIDPTPEP